MLPPRAVMHFRLEQRSQNGGAVGAADHDDAVAFVDDRRFRRIGEDIAVAAIDLDDE